MLKAVSGQELSVEAEAFQKEVRFMRTLRWVSWMCAFWFSS